MTKCYIIFVGRIKKLLRCQTLQTLNEFFLFSFACVILKSPDQKIHYGKMSACLIVVKIAIFEKFTCLFFVYKIVKN